MLAMLPMLSNIINIIDKRKGNYLFPLKSVQ